VLVVWSPAALRQVAGIVDYLDELNPRAAAEVSASLIAAGDSLPNFSHRARPVPKTDMRELVTTYPYVIRYRIGRDHVRIPRRIPESGAPPVLRRR
jgi:plasmid stabilization system protein ParE